MCIVTFIPVNEKIFITSKRDEKTGRALAQPPAFNAHGDCDKLLFPRDPVANGSWITLKENGDAAVLLNGAFIPHRQQPSYRKSRGLVLLDIMAMEKPAQSFIKTSLQDIEPFTMLILESGSLYEFRWDGNEKFSKSLPAGDPHIWTSATLYDGIAARTKVEAFGLFLRQHPVPTQKDIMDFDADKHAQPGNHFIMPENEQYATVSITSILLTRDRGTMKHADLLTGKMTERKMALLTSDSHL